MTAWTGTRLSRVLQGRGWPLTAYQPVSAYSQLDKSVPAAPQGLPAAAQGLPAAAQGLPAAAQGLPAAAHPQQLHKGVVVASQEGRFHKSLPTVTTAAAVALDVSLQT